MQRFRKILIGSALAATTLTGGALGAALIGGAAGAQDTTSSTAAPQSTAPTSGTQTAPPNGGATGTPPSGQQGTPPSGQQGTPPSGQQGTPPSGQQGNRPDPSKGGHQANGKTEKLLTGTQKTKAEAAAKAAVSGGTVQRSETDAEGAAFEVHMTKSDGSQVTVKLDASFKVASIENGPA